jgi:hypothetical protein
VFAYATVTLDLLIEQRRLAIAFGAQPVLTALLFHESDSVVSAAAQAVESLTRYGVGDIYANFVEKNVFARLMDQFRYRRMRVEDMLVSVAGDFPLPACCVTFVTALNERMKLGNSIDSGSAFRCFGRLARCRGFSCSVILSFSLILPHL